MATVKGEAKLSYSIKHLCKQFNISRSALLYYDQIGLLKASDRTAANYRKYSDQDVKRLEKICVYRQMGLPLREIKSILDAKENEVKYVLEQRLHELNEEINDFRRQQLVIIKMLKNEQLLRQLRCFDRDTLVNLLRSIGIDDMGISRLHAELERTSPEGHQQFLQFLGINEEEIKQIRKFSREFINK